MESFDHPLKLTFECPGCKKIKSCDDLSDGYSNACIECCPNPPEWLTFKCRSCLEVKKKDKSSPHYDVCEKCFTKFFDCKNCHLFKLKEDMSSKRNICKECLPKIIVQERNEKKRLNREGEKSINSGYRCIVCKQNLEVGKFSKTQLKKMNNFNKTCKTCLEGKKE